jgi:hypothetical protein
MADLLEQAHGAVDRFVTGVGNALGVDFDDDQPRETDDTDIRVRVTPRSNMLPPALPASAQLALPSATQEQTVARAFEVIERDGKFFVTNGAIGQACPTRAYAEQVLAALTAAVNVPAKVERLGGGGRR